MSSEWPLVLLTDVCEFQEGPGILAKDFRDDGVPLIRLKGVESPTVTLTGCNYLDPDMVQKKWNHFRLHPGDLLISTSATLGRVSEVAADAEGAVAYTGLIRFRPLSDSLDRAFLKVFLGSKEFLLQAEASASGSVIRHFGPSHLKKMQMTLPPISIQESIGSFADSINDRIDNLRATNDTLEAIAQAIFKSWFIDFDPVRAKMEGREPEGMDAETAALFPSEFEESELGLIPKGWRVRPLSEHVQTTIGGVWGEEYQSEKSIRKVLCFRGIDAVELSAASFPNPPVRWISSKQIENRRLNEGDILVEGSGSFCGRSLFWLASYNTLFDDQITYSNFVKRLSSPTGPATAHWASRHIKRLNDNGDISTYRTGSAFPNFDVAALLERDFVAPNHEQLFDRFYRIVNFLKDGEAVRIHQARQLRDIRDLLLPRLISGKLRVSPTECADAAD